jgi:asparagine synthase (glutamine-hydrolysing)
MAFSLESREPLLDHSLVEWCMRLPLRWKLRGRTAKYLWRKLAYRYVPREILDRPKRGFGVPIDRWLRGPLREWARGLIEDSAACRSLGLEQQRIRELFALHLSGRRSPHPLLWATLVLLSFAARGTQQEAPLAAGCR